MTGPPIVAPMKCKSVACLWSGSPPVHRVTAVAAIHEPPTLYTGGYDGTIIWWNLLASPEKTSMIKIKVLDASGPPGLPGLLGGTSEMVINSAISAPSFSPDGEGLAAFSENGLMYGGNVVGETKSKFHSCAVHQADIYSSMGRIFTQFY